MIFSRGCQRSGNTDPSETTSLFRDRQVLKTECLRQKVSTVVPAQTI